MSAHVNSRADVCHSAPQPEDSVLSGHVLLIAGVAHSWPVLHACLSETLCDFARYGPVPRVLRFTCLVRGDIVQFVCCVGSADMSPFPLCNRRRSGLNQPGISFQRGTGPRLSLIVRGPVDEKCDS